MSGKVCLSAALAAVVLGIAACPSAAQHVWGTSTATPLLDLGWEQSWEYRLYVHWDISEVWLPADNALMFFLNSGDCLCCEDCFAFADTAGTGTGENGGLTYFFGEFLCEGDPVFRSGDFSLRFEHFNEQTAAKAGSAVLRFRSIRAPTQEGKFPDAIRIRVGGVARTGEIVGVLPSCDAALTDVVVPSWSGMKTRYK